jgi:hypothetical protein
MKSNRMVRATATAHVLLLVAAVGSGCHRELPAAALVPGKVYPRTVAEAQSLRASGVNWSNGEIRARYLELIAAIAPADRALVAAGRSDEERARAAFATRHEARLTARAMMSDPREVDDLRARDRAVYGSEDGPTFDWLVAHDRARGLDADAAYRAIVESAQRTNNAVNELFGLGR